MPRSPSIPTALALASLAIVPSTAQAVTRPRADRIALHALAPGKDGPHVEVFGLAQALPRGTQLGQDGPGGRLARTRHTRRGDALPVAAAMVRLPRDAWLYWEDLLAGAEYEHPSELLLVDRRSGRVTRRKLSWQPLIDGRPAPFTDGRKPFHARSRQLFGSKRSRAHASVRAHAAASLIPAAALRGDCMVTIGDVGDKVFRKNLAAMGTLAGTLGIPLRKANDAQDLAAKVDELAAAEEKCTDVFIYLAGHGLPAPGTIPNDGHRARLFSRKPTVSLGTHVRTERGVVKLVVTADDLKALIDRHPGLTFKLLIQSCFAGRFTSFFTGHQGVRLAVASSAANEPSWRNQRAERVGTPRTATGPLVINPFADTGYSHFTFNLFSEVTRLASDRATVDRLDGDLAAYFDAAAGNPIQDYTASLLHWTHPQHFLVPKPAPKPPALTPTPEPAPPPDLLFGFQTTTVPNVTGPVGGDIRPSGDFLYLFNANANNVAPVPLDMTTGRPTGGTIPTVSVPAPITGGLSPDATHLWVGSPDRITNLISPPNGFLSQLACYGASPCTPVGAPGMLSNLVIVAASGNDGAIGVNRSTGTFFQLRVAANGSPTAFGCSNGTGCANTFTPPEVVLDTRVIRVTGNHVVGGGDNGIWWGTTTATTGLLTDFGCLSSSVVGCRAAPGGIRNVTKIVFDPQGNPTHRIVFDTDGTFWITDYDSGGDQLDCYGSANGCRSTGVVNALAGLSGLAFDRTGRLLIGTAPGARTIVAFPYAGGQLGTGQAYGPGFRTGPDLMALQVFANPVTNMLYAADADNGAFTSASTNPGP